MPDNIRLIYIANIKAVLSFFCVSFKLRLLWKRNRCPNSQLSSTQSLRGDEECVSQNFVDIVFVSKSEALIKEKGESLEDFGFIDNEPPGGVDF
jgi:hypothetical protein